MSELCLTLSYLLDPNMILSILHSIAILAVDSLIQPPTLTSVNATNGDCFVISAP